MTKGRSALRFAPDEGTIALIDPDHGEDKSQFKPTIHALVVDEAMDGCGLVVVNNTRLEIGDICLVQVGQLDPLSSELRWIRQLDEDVQKIGFMYLE